RFGSRRIEHDAHDPDGLLRETTGTPGTRGGIGRRRSGTGTDLRKTFDLLPRGAAVAALPQSFPARAEVKNIAAIRIHREPFAVEAAGFVAAHAERHVGAFEGASAIGRAEDRGVALTVGAGGEIDAIGIR